jgi:hypothetical protein
MTGTASLVDRINLRYHGSLVTALAHGNELGDFVLRPILGFLELGRVREGRRRRTALLFAIRRVSLPLRGRSCGSCRRLC